MNENKHNVNGIKLKKRTNVSKIQYTRVLTYLEGMLKKSYAVWIIMIFKGHTQLVITDPA